MSWILMALLGHGLNGVAFVIDKVLLRQAFVRSATYAGLISLLSGILIFAIPFLASWPVGLHWLPVIGFGVSFVFALWSFFEAMRRGAVTVVVPVVGSLIPLLTFLGSVLFLGIGLQGRGLMGFFLLLLSIGLLTYQPLSKRNASSLFPVFGFSLVSAILFSVSNVLGKLAFSLQPFWTVFVWSRVAAAVTGLLLLVLIDRLAGKELIASVGPQKKTGPSSLPLAIFGQVLGSLGFVLVNASLSEGNPALVSALQSVQYGCLFLIALFGGARLTKLLGESFDRSTLIRRLMALVCIAFGLWLIVLV